VKDYYAILGVNRSATEFEIKRSYRKLAVTYHPDKNPDPAAEQLFKEINEAYDVLGDADKKRGYDYIVSNSLTEILEQPQPRHKDPAYRRRRPARPPNYKSENQRMLEFMAEYVPVANKIIIISFIVSVFFVFDFLLPKKISHEKIISTNVTRTHSKSGSQAWWTITTDHNRVLDVHYKVSDHFPAGSTIKIYSSVFLNVPFSVETDLETERISKTIYGNFLFAPLALLLTSSLGMAFRKNIERAFNYGVICVIVLAITFIIFLIFK
jgi:hypothetical protein